jgi:hypothetical protein
MNNLNKTTKFSVTSYDRTTTIEVDHCDVDMGEFLDIVKVLAIGMTFHEDTFKRGIIELAETYKDEDSEDDKFFGKWSESDLDTAFAEHNATEEEADWDVTLNDGLENDGWTEELEKQYWEEQVPKPFATPEELKRDGEFDDYGKRIVRVEKKTKKDAKRK